MPVKLTVSGLSKRFDALEALRGIDLAVERANSLPWSAQAAAARPRSCASSRASSRRPRAG